MLALGRVSLITSAARLSVSLVYATVFFLTNRTNFTLLKLRTVVELPRAGSIVPKAAVIAASRLTRAKREYFQDHAASVQGPRPNHSPNKFIVMANNARWLLDTF